VVGHGPHNLRPGRRQSPRPPDQIQQVAESLRLGQPRGVPLLQLQGHRIPLGPRRRQRDPLLRRQRLQRRRGARPRHPLLGPAVRVGLGPRTHLRSGLRQARLRLQQQRKTRQELRLRQRCERARVHHRHLQSQRTGERGRCGGVTVDSVFAGGGCGELRPAAPLHLEHQEIGVGGGARQRHHQPVHRHRSGVEEGRVEDDVRGAVRRRDALRVGLEEDRVEGQIRNNVRGAQSGSGQAPGHQRQGGYNQVAKRGRDRRGQNHGQGLLPGCANRRDSLGGRLAEKSPQRGSHRRSTLPGLILLLSQVPWNNSGRHEKFYFDYPTVCLVFNAGELTLVEYGDNDVLCSVRTEFANPHLISVRLNERNQTIDNKKLAYLLDLKTICVVDLMTGMLIGQITHDSKIDWLELNETGHKLLFRDKKQRYCQFWGNFDCTLDFRLILVDVLTQNKQCIFTGVNFVQWVEGSDVAVAQAGTNLAIWYNIELPENPTIMTVKGDVTDIVRNNGKTEAVCVDGNNVVNLELDEGLVEFGKESSSAIWNLDYFDCLRNRHQRQRLQQSRAVFGIDGQLFRSGSNVAQPIDDCFERAQFGAGREVQRRSGQHRNGALSPRDDKTDGEVRRRYRRQSGSVGEVVDPKRRPKHRREHFSGARRHRECPGHVQEVAQMGRGLEVHHFKSRTVFHIFCTSGVFLRRLKSRFHPQGIK
jgi:hypothetical protein